MKLNQKWKELRNTANTENVLMTISDIVKYYERGRININPAYQRNYRWTNEQKTKFIESLLLKYPIPPIITIKTENESGLYNFEVIDGVQRLSTIFEFVKSSGTPVINTVESLDKLSGANKFLDINGKDYSDFKKEEFDFIFDSSTILFINLSTNDEDVKYEMFERLNTLSTVLSEQEIRNSIIALKDKDKYKKISSEIYDLSKDIFSDPELGKRIDLEYFIEFSLVKRYEQYKQGIDDKIKILYEANSKDRARHFDIFLSSFVRLVTIENLESDIVEYKEFLSLNKELNFKKYDSEKFKTTGNPVKFFFELLSFQFFKDKKLISKSFYEENFSETYGFIMKNKLRKNNPNAKARFELAQKIISENKNGINIFNS